MKIICKISTIIFGVVAMVSCLDGKKEQSVKINTVKEVKDAKAVVPDQFDQGFTDGMTGTLWNYYSKIRLALINSDTSETRTTAGDLKESFGDQHGDLKAIASKMAEEENLEDQRKLFSDLTNGLEPIFKKAISEGVIYKQFCPMAFNNKGAYWLSNVPEIRNPFYGDKMLDCGSTREIIKNSKS